VPASPHQEALARGRDGARGGIPQEESPQTQHHPHDPRATHHNGQW